MKVIQGYVQRVRQTQTPVLVRALLDLQVIPNNDIEKLTVPLKNILPIRKSVTAEQAHGNLHPIVTVLESRFTVGTTDVDIYTSFAKVQVDTNRDERHFLKANVYYDSRDIGKFCLKQDPSLTFIAYRHDLRDEGVL